MDREIKINLNVTLKGRVMLSEQVAQNKPECHDSFSMVVTGHKNKASRINVSVRKTIPAKQTINMTKDAYEEMIDGRAVPYWIKPHVWYKMNTKERLEAHLSRISESLGGISYTYNILNN